MYEMKYIASVRTYRSVTLLYNSIYIFIEFNEKKEKEVMVRMTKNEKQTCD